MTRFLRSAPDSPGVEDASSPRSTSSARRTLLVWTLRIASRPALSGRFHHTPVEAPGPQECLVEHVGLVGGGENDHALLAGETIHLGEDLVEGLLLLARSPTTADRGTVLWSRARR